MDFWERVKEQVKAQNTTQEWVATKAGQKLRTFQGWISRDIMPNADQAHAIAYALGVTVEYLVTGERPEIDLPWIKAHASLIEDMKILTKEELDLLTLGIRQKASERREQLGKSSASGQTGA